MTMKNAPHSSASAHQRRGSEPEAAAVASFVTSPSGAHRAALQTSVDPIPSRRDHPEGTQLRCPAARPARSPRAVPLAPLTSRRPR
jgi:hypothetical protein